MNGTNGNEPGYPEKALVPYPVILAATKGDPDAMKIVLQHFSGYIARLSMDIAAVVVSVRVGADNGLVSGKLLSAKFLAQRLRPVYGQTVVHRVPWVKADNVVVAFYIFPLLVLPIAEIGAHTGNGKILVAAVQRGYSIVLPEHEPPVFIKGGLHGKLVMFKGEVLLGCAIVRIFRADMFECCQQRHPLSARLQTSRRQGRKWRLALQQTAYCRAFRIR